LEKKHVFVVLHAPFLACEFSTLRLDFFLGYLISFHHVISAVPDSSWFLFGILKWCIYGCDDTDLMQHVGEHQLGRRSLCSVLWSLSASWLPQGLRPSTWCTFHCLLFYVDW